MLDLDLDHDRAAGLAGAVARRDHGDAGHAPRRGRRRLGVRAVLAAAQRQDGADRGRGGDDDDESGAFFVRMDAGKLSAAP